MGVIANLIVRIGADVAALDKTFAGLERGAAQIQKTYEKLGGQLQGIGSKLTAGLTLPIVGLGTAAVKTFADFESAMKGVEAALVPTGVELKALEAAALEWGSKTKFSATESATALGELGKAGFNVEQSIGALPSVLQLATVSGLGLEQAATLTADTLKQFGLDVGEAARVNDVLAKAAQTSTVDVAQLGLSMKYAGPVAAGLGLSFEQTNAALAAFGNVGIKADTAGIALKNTLGAVVNTTKPMRDVLAELGIETLKSADGTVSLATVIDKLNAAGATAGQVLKAFGDQAGPGMVALVNQGSGPLRDLEKAMADAGGTADKAAQVMMSGLGGALEEMKGATETAGVAIGSILAPAVTVAANAVQRIAEFLTSTVVPAFRNLPAPVQAAAGGLAALLAAAGPIIYVAGTLVSTWGAVAGAFAQGAAGAKVAAGALAFVTGPIGLTIAAVTALIVGLRYFTGSWENVLRVLSLGLLDFGRVAAIWELLKAGASLLVGALQTLGEYIGGRLVAAWQAFRGILEAVAESGFGRLVRAVGEFIAKAAGWAIITSAVVQWEALKIIVSAVGEAFSWLWSVVEPVASFINGVVGQAIGILWEQLSRLASVIGGAVVAGFRSVVEWLDKLAGKAADVINWLSRTIPGFDKVADAAKRAGATAADLGGKIFATGSAADAAVAPIGKLETHVGKVAKTADAATPPLSRLSTETAGAGKAAEKAAKQLAELASELSGTKAIAEAERYLEALKAIPHGARLTVDAQKKVNDVMSDALDVYKALGRQAPIEMQKVWAATLDAPDIERNIARVLEGVDWNRIRNDIVGRTIPLGLAIAPEAIVPPDLGFNVARLMRERLEQAKATVTAWAGQIRESLASAIGGAAVGVQTWGEAFGAVFGQLRGMVQQWIGGVVDTLIEGLSSGKLMESLKAIGAELKALGQSSKLVRYGAGAAVGGVLGYAVGSKYGPIAGAAAGAGSGALVGASVGGVPGALVGAGVGALVGWYSGSKKNREAKKQMEADRLELVKVYGGMEKLREAAQRFGVDIDKAFSTKKPEEYGRIVGEFAAKLEAEEHTIEQIATGLERVGASGGLLSSSLLRDISKAPPGAAEDVFAFMEDQAKRAITGIGVFLENATIKTKGGATAIAGTIAGLYEELQRQGVPATEAFRQLEPLIAKFGTAAAGVVGVQVPEAFARLQAFAALAADEIAGPVFDAMSGLEQGLTSTFNLGLLNQETFAGFAAEITAGYQALELQGKGGELALQGMRGALQKVYELQTDFGYQVDDDTQRLLDFAESSGLIGDKFRPAADRMAAAIDKLVERFDLFLNRVTAGTASAADQAANDLKNKFGDLAINVPKIEIEGHVAWSEDYPDSWRYEGGVPAMASGGIVRKPTIALIGEAGPEAVVPLSRAGFNTAQEAAIYLDSEVIARATLRKEGRIVKSYGVMRR